MAASGSADKVPQDVVAIFHMAFHPTQGNVVDWSLKASDDFDLSHVEFSCLPSGLHLMERDVVYFTKDDHAGVCIFRRRKTNEQGHRGFRLSSIGILLAKSARPRPWRHVPALKELAQAVFSSLEDRHILIPLDSDWDPARAFFAERQVRRPDLGGSGDWAGWDAELQADASNTNPTVHLSHMLRILGPSCLTLYKHVLGRRRVLIFTLPPVEAACILCQVAADICFEDQKEGGLGQGEQLGARKMKGKSREGVKVLGMVTLNDMDKLEKESKTGRGWVACTTDALFLEKPAYYDLLIDLRTSTPNTRPTFYVPKAEQSNGRASSYRLSQVRFTWSDVKLWTELDRLLQLDSEHGHGHGHGHDVCSESSIKSASAWTDIWRVYEDVCVMCAGLWMGSWRAQGAAPPAYSSLHARSENWGSLRLEGPDELVHPTVRTVGLGIEGRPAPASVRSKPLRRSSTMSAWTLPLAGTAVESSVGVRGEDDDDAKERQVLTTLALLQTFRNHTATTLARLGDLLPQRSLRTVTAVTLTPKDVMSFELGPFSGLDARFVEWLGEEYGGGIRVTVKRGWRDLMGLLLGLG